MSLGKEDHICSGLCLLSQCNYSQYCMFLSEVSQFEQHITVTLHKNCIKKDVSAVTRATYLNSISYSQVYLLIIKPRTITYYCFGLKLTM